jgi:hypothetical protein
LCQWADDRGKEFEVVAQVRDADAPVADRALEIVRKFIVERGLILYGGQAIDFALRLKGSRIYPDHQTPDFDFFSPQSVDDAYDLADILRDAGFANVGAIPAIHVQTMRVKTDFIFVADISYAPRAVFDSFPTVSFAGMRVLHPDYQRTDMHLAFCFPFNNPPREDVFHRFPKDLKRFRLYQEFYPITTGKALSAPVTGGADPADRQVVEVDLARVAVHGFAAFGVFRATFALLAAAAEGAGVSKKVLAEARALGAKTPAVEVTFEAAAGGKTRIRFNPPAAAARLVLATPWPDEVVAGLADARDGADVAWYAPYMDSRPLMARVSGGGQPDVDVHSTKSRLLAVSVVDAPGPKGAAPTKVTIVSPQYLLLNFLYEAHVSEGAARDLYVEYYGATLRLLEAADLLIAALRAEEPGPKVPEDTYRAFVESSPFGLTVRALGDVNHDASYLIRLAGSARNVGDTPPGVDPADLPDPSKVPAKYFPGGHRDTGSAAEPKHPAFDYEANVAFQRAGQLIHAPSIEGGRPEGTRPSRGSTANMAAGPKELTYLILFEQLNRAPLDRALRAAGWRSLSLRDAMRAGAVDLLAVDGKYNWDRRLWQINCGVKSRLNALEITNKVNLHLRLSEAAPDLIPETVVFGPPQELRGNNKKERERGPTIPKEGEVWIWRPEQGCSGRGVVAFTTQAELDEIWAEHLATFPKERGLISRYLVDPALIVVGGTLRKFHLRLYFLVVAIPEGTPGVRAGRRSALYTSGEIAHSKEPYARDDYANPEVHDTHIKWSEERRFPRDYPGGPREANKVLDQARSMLTRVSEVLLPTVAPYAECLGGYEIYGVDLMVDAAGRAWLIEINSRPGYTMEAGDPRALRQRRDWISDFVLRGVAEFALGLPVRGESPLLVCQDLPYACENAI